MLWKMVTQLLQENSADLDNPLSESMVRSLKRNYTVALQAKKHSITKITDVLMLSSLLCKAWASTTASWWHGFTSSSIH